MFAEFSVWTCMYAFLLMTSIGVVNWLQRWQGPIKPEDRVKPVPPEVAGNPEAMSQWLDSQSPNPEKSNDDVTACGGKPA